MTSFAIHTVSSAPPASRPLLERTQQAFGFVPNLAAVLAEAPAALEAFLALDAAFGRSSLSATERQVVLLTVSRVHECGYCMAAHTVIAGGQRVPADVVAALRGGAALADARLEALRTLTLAVVAKRGRLDEADLGAFFSAGYTRAQLLEVLTGVTVKTLTNYANHVAATPLDAAFRAQAWEPAACAC